MADEFSEGLDDLPGDAPAPKVPAKAKLKAPVEPDPEPKPDHKPEPKAHTHSMKLITKARAFGASQEYLDTHTSAEIWEEIAGIEEAQARRKPEPKKAEPDADEDEVLLAEIEAELDPRVAKLLKSQHAKLKAAREDKAKTDEKLTAFERQHAQRRDADVNTMLDDAFDAMPAKFKKILGDGSGADPAFLKSPEGKRRIRVFQEAGIDLNKATLKSTKRALLEAAETLFGFVEADEDEQPEPAPKPKKKLPPQDEETGRFTKEQFNGAKLAKGSARQTGIDQMDVVEGVRHIQRANGYMSAAVEGDLDDLPG